MDYIDARILLAKPEPLTGKDAVEIINSWRSNPENYQLLLQTKGASIPLSVYSSYSKEEERHLFKPTDKLILHPTLAYKFFELGNDDLNIIFLETLDYLTFDLDDDEDEDQEDENCGFYAWPYLVGGCAHYLSAEVIERVLLNWNFVFDWEFDGLGSIYSLLYKKLYVADKCCDTLAVNSFNLFNWLDRDDQGVDVDVRAKHYCFANNALDLDNTATDAYFRKSLVHYLTSMWYNLDDIVSYIVSNRVSRNN